MTNDSLKKYYGDSGEYLDDHRLFLESANLEYDTNFLIRALKLNKKDRILDIACGQGRHTNYLAQNGYHIDGTDFSDYLIEKARKAASQLNNDIPKYFVADVMNLDLPQNYNKAFWFFSDLANIDIPLALKSLNNAIEVGGMVLIDTDNMFRIVSHLMNNPKSKYRFDAEKFKLIDDKKNLSVPYPPFPVWEKWTMEANFSIEKIIGDYDFGEYSIRSPRLILVIKKTA